MVEPAERLQALVQRVLAGVPERRVADVVGQRDRFREVFVQPQPAGDGAGDLSHFERVRESRAVVVVDAGDEDLGLAGHAAERGAVDDALAVALVEGAERVSGFGVPAAPRGPRRHRVGREPPVLEGEPVVGDGCGHCFALRGMLTR